MFDITLESPSAGFHPLESAIGLDYQSPATQDQPDPDFATKKSAYISNLQDLVSSAKQNRAQLSANPLFPPVRAKVQETIPDTAPDFTERRLAGDPIAPVSSDPATYNDQMDGKLYQHQMTVVATGMETTVSDDRNALQSFLSECQ